MSSDNIYILSEKKFDGAKNLPVIQIKFINPSKMNKLSQYEALVFSSKNGVEALNSIDKSWKDIPSYSIGSGTSGILKKLGANLVYSAKSSYGDDFANEITQMLKGKRVLFCRAKVVTSSLNQILLDAGVLLDEIVIYETICGNCDDLVAPPLNSTIIFSSPSTIKCFFKCFNWDESYRAIVIGTRTASYMPKNIVYDMSNEQNIDSCIKLAKQDILK